MSAQTQERKSRAMLPALLVGIGAFLLTCTLMNVFVIVPAQKVTPLDSVSTTLTQESPANLFSAAAFAKGEPLPGNADMPECKEPEPAKPAERPEGDGADAAREGERPAAEPAESAPAELPMSCFMERGVPVIAQRHTISVEPGDKNDVTLQAAQSILRTDKKDAGDGSAALVNATLDRVTADRKTGMPIDGNNGSTELLPQSATGEAPTEYHREGVQYKFPFDPEKKDYPYFDLNTMTTNPIHFVEESDQSGVPVYVYEQELGPINMFESLSDHFQQTQPGYSKAVNTVLASYRLSGTAGRWGLAGDPKREVKMSRFYTNTRTLKVSQKTGQILWGQEDQFQFFAENQAAADGFWNDKAAVEQERQHPTHTAIAYRGAWDQPTIDRAIKNSMHSANKLNAFGRILPISMGIVGFLFVLGGVVLGARRR